MTYTPNQQILDNYANIMVNFALWGTKWIKKWDSVFVYIPECAKPFLIPLQTAILKKWWHPIIKYQPDWIQKNFYQNANQEQIEFMADAYLKWEIANSDHRIIVLADNDKQELNNINPKKITDRITAFNEYREIRNKKENEWKFTWSICLYGTESMAKEANLSLEDYRWQIIEACFLDKKNPIEKWRDIDTQINDNIEKLNDLEIEYVNIKWEDVDLNIKIWKSRKRLWWKGCNIPSFEIFTSPDRRETNWWIYLNQPLYRYWQIIKWIRLEFKDWIVIKATAEENNEMIQKMISIKNMDKIWEFSMTDKKFSRINKFMAETLYDENIWWEFGNSHIALWMSFDESYNWDYKDLSSKQHKELWLNKSPEHVDIITTSNRTVVATLQDGTKKTIYQNWEFIV